MNEPTPSVAGMPAKTSGLAITSLVLGILSVLLLIVCLGPLLAIPAIICGHVAFSKIGKSGGQLQGRGLAMAGFITGYVSLALTLLLVPIAIPNFVKARQAAQKAVCVRQLERIDAAKSQWALENHKDKDAIATWDDLNKYLNSSEPLKCPAGGTYSINTVGEPATCSIPEHRRL
jgi:competence protein ComGC